MFGQRTRQKKYQPFLTAKALSSSLLDLWLMLFTPINGPCKSQMYFGKILFCKYWHGNNSCFSFCEWNRPPSWWKTLLFTFWHTGTSRGRGLARISSNLLGGWIRCDSDESGPKRASGLKEGGCVGVD